MSFWYATYCAVGLGILGICGIYYVFWMYILPNFGKYRIRQELLALGGETAKTNRLIKVPLEELATWDAEHDVQGQNLGSAHETGHVSQNSEYDGVKDEQKVV